MNKNWVITFIVIVLVAVAGWYFVARQSTMKSSDHAMMQESISPSPSEAMMKKSPSVSPTEAMMKNDTMMKGNH